MLIPSGPPNARLMIVLDCVTYRDLQSQTILSDREFDRILSDAGIPRAQVFITALIREQVHGQDFDLQVARSKREITPAQKILHNRHVNPCVMDGLDRLYRDIDLVKPKIILALGNGSLFSLTGKWGIKSWRSSILPITTPSNHSCHVVPTYTPEFIKSVWKEQNVVIHDIRKAWALALSAEPIVPPDYRFIIEPSFSEAAGTLRKLLQLAASGPLKLSTDVETRGGHLACVGIAWSELDAICIPQMRATSDPNRLNYWATEEEETFITYLLYQLLTHPNVGNVGQNFIYDCQYFYRHLLFIPRFLRDTMWASHSMFSNMPKGLDFLSSMHSKHHVYWKDESKNWDPKLGERQLWIYNCLDCVRTYEIDESQQSAVEAFLPSWPELRSVHDFQQSLFYPVLQTMIIGLRVDNSSKSQLSSDLAEAISLREAWLTDVIGHPINIKSPPQMQDLFYRELAQKPIISRKTGSVTCDDSALKKIGTREPLLLPIVRTISELRSLGVFHSTFLKAPVDIDNRMRCSFNVAGTETYRFSSSENAFGSGMNLQNIPIGDEFEGLPNIRKLFLADPGMEMFDIDLDSADLRIVVWESDCLEMKAMFSENLKPYVEVAKEYYHDPSINKHHPSYKLFKALCHGTNYLGSASGLAGQIGLVTHEIDRIQKWYYGKFPEIKIWQDDLCAQLRSNRYVRNVFGYRIYFFDRIEGTIYNQAVAAVPQSTVACLINRGYHNLATKSPEIPVLLQVHDSLTGQYPIANRDEAIPKIISHCSIPLEYPSGTLTIPVGIKTSTISWGDCQ
jgi:DNA polymerase I-like protein with 3'-5' exonuclease and polymerase domains/uracil-DNA glycosylase